MHKIKLGDVANQFTLLSIEVQKKILNILWDIQETKELSKRLLITTEDLIKSQFYVGGEQFA